MYLIHIELFSSVTLMAAGFYNGLVDVQYMQYTVLGHFVLLRGHSFSSLQLFAL